MTAATQMPAVSECTVTGCSYNDHAACTAFAITVGGTGVDASCATFIPLGSKGGLGKVTSQVGACQRADCSFNQSLECTAPSVRVGAGNDTADCLTYTQR
jgi:hypothetical protein